MNSILGAELEQVGYALRPMGDALLENVEQLFSAADRFFALPLERKKQCQNKRYLIGFRDAGIEFSKSPDRPDLMEAYSV
ncbi:MAG: 2-oxoglutarate and iron-dependent oxygenase domain-containing protein, partial [Nitrospiraceae bacterium]|nr:2-oxoglutarate and iron-dependent oxygenase domain-containing protein [Nitrospiraceae bacterium]